MVLASVVAGMEGLGLKQLLMQLVRLLYARAEAAFVGASALMQVVVG